MKALASLPPLTPKLVGIALRCCREPEIYITSPPDVMTHSCPACAMRSAFRVRPVPLPPTNGKATR
jgi:hypothetical protein